MTMAITSAYEFILSSIDQPGPIRHVLGRTGYEERVRHSTAIITTDVGIPADSVIGEEPPRVSVNTAPK